MKKPLHIIVLLVTLVWICVPQQAGENSQPQTTAQVRMIHAESGLAVFLTNLSAKPDSRVDLAHFAPLPDPPQFDFGRFAAENGWSRDFGTFIFSHHLYTQTTSSYL